MQDNIVKLSQPGAFSDPLTEVLRAGARPLLVHAVEAEVAGLIVIPANRQSSRQRCPCCGRSRG